MEITLIAEIGFEANRPPAVQQYLARIKQLIEEDGNGQGSSSGAAMDSGPTCYTLEPQRLRTNSSHAVPGPPDLFA